jgi:2-oxoisovalerate dehydrogenase E1 component beta subunit
MPQMSLIEAIRDALDAEMGLDERVIVLGEDVGLHGGVFRATDGLQNKYGEARVIDTPLAELMIVGVAIGAAATGRRPVAEMQFADFGHPAFDQIVSDAARWRYRTNGARGIPLVIRMPYGAGIHGALYHSQSVEAFYAHVPGLRVVAPSTPYDAKGLLISAIRDPDPVIFLEHKKAYRLIRGDVPEGGYTVPLDQARIARPGEDLSIFAYGLMLHHCLEAAKALAAEGVDAEVVDLRSLAPLDREAILTSARKTGKVLVVHEDNKTLGLGAELAALIAEEAFEWLDGPIMRVAAPDIPAMPYNHPQETWALPGVDQIAAAMRDLAAY